MNLQELIEKLKYDRPTQVSLALILLAIIIFIFLFKSLFFPFKEQAKLPCYNAVLKIWSPFKEDDLKQLTEPFTRFCIKFIFEEKSLKEMNQEFLYSLAENSAPDIIYLNSQLLNEFQKFLATPTPVNLDTLVAYYNSDVLNFFQLEKPRTLDELKNFIIKIKNFRQEDFFPVGLGTNKIRNRKEIILSLTTFNENYQDKEKFLPILEDTFNFYTDFANFESENFSYSWSLDDDLKSFANEKLALYLGFYQDKKEIEKISPRLNYEIYFSPLNTFPPKAKSYLEVFYFIPVKKGKESIANYFLDWFTKDQLKKLTEIYDLIPYFANSSDLPSDKKIVYETAKNYGETFGFLEKKIIFESLEKILNVWQNKDEVNEIFKKLKFSL